MEDSIFSVLPLLTMDHADRLSAVEYICHRPFLGSPMDCVQARMKSRPSRPDGDKHDATANIRYCLFQSLPLDIVQIAFQSRCGTPPSSKQGAVESYIWSLFLKLLQGNHRSTLWLPHSSLAYGTHRVVAAILHCPFLELRRETSQVASVSIRMKRQLCKQGVTEFFPCFPCPSLQMGAKRPTTE